VLFLAVVEKGVIDGTKTRGKRGMGDHDMLERVPAGP